MGCINPNVHVSQGQRQADEAAERGSALVRVLEARLRVPPDLDPGNVFVFSFFSS